ncbi:MAG: peptide MFS transporter [Chitinophagales bacterium]|nr:peptide MFS transporter [Chitinophagales bacterium]MCZ2394496.1 peptide MFS transporter [Chitinophagales bacterium]
MAEFSQATSEEKYFSDNTLGHPKQLALLFMTEMWERFSFYGMRALLILYMVSQLQYSDEKGNLVYGSYQALVYTMPLFGGLIADKIFGFRRSVVLGGLLMMIGHLTLAIPQENTFYIGLGFLISGNGFFKPNISSMVGRLYRPGDSRRDAGFSIFYLGINVGAFMGGLACGYLGQKVNWHYGFGLAGIFMALGLIVFLLGQKSLGHIGLAPEPNTIKNFKQKQIAVVLLGFLQVPVFVVLLLNYKLMGYLLLPFCILAIIWVLIIAFRQEKVARQKMLTAVVLIFFSTFFWAFYEQGGGSLNLFADRNVDMLGLSSAAINNSINPFYILLLTFPIAWLWVTLSKKNMNPSTPAKFAIAFILLGIGYYIFVSGGFFANEGMVNLGFFAGGYLLITIGELFISPIGLSMITKLSPEKFTGMMMGFWFLASAMGQYLAGVIGTLMAIPSEGAETSISALNSLSIYSGVFTKITLAALIVAMILFAFTPLLKRWMHDVK